MARNPEDRYESYAAFIEQLEDAKRRITDPDYRGKQAEDVVILGTEDTAKARTWIMVGLAAVVVLLLGLLAWKGSSFFQQKQTVSSELNDYAPTAETTAAETTPAETMAEGKPAGAPMRTTGGSAAPTGPNLALNKPVVSSDPNPHGKPGAPTDGQHTYLSGASADFPKSMTIDLGEMEAVNRVIVTEPAVGATKTIQVLLSDDGATFRGVGRYAFTQGQAERHVYGFPASTARYIQLNYLDHYDEAFGTKLSPNVMLTRKVEAYGP
jgi:hypothetical protein